jgi:hypothetical protein
LLSPRLLVLVFLPPLATAALFTSFAVRRPDAWRRHRRAGASAVLVLALAAMSCRVRSSEWSAFAYASFAHVILALAIVAAGAIVALALAQRRRTHTGVARYGVVIPEPMENEPVACLQVATWLRGPRMLARAFQVLTRDGIVDVPAGTELVVALPDVSTMVPTGDAIAVLHVGDRVAVEGFVTPPAGDPFRRSAVLVPGRNGIIVTRMPDESRTFAALALALWRPAIAYLIVTTIAALPGLVAALWA